MKNINFADSRIKIKSDTGVPFVVTYHPRLKAVGKIIHEILHLLYMNDEIKDTFTPSPIVFFIISQKLGSYLVRAKLYPLERTVGSWKCNKEQFKTFENVENSDTFRSSITSETFKINHWLICDDKYQVYLFTCKTC